MRPFASSASMRSSSACLASSAAVSSSARTCRPESFAEQLVHPAVVVGHLVPELVDRTAIRSSFCSGLVVSLLRRYGAEAGPVNEHGQADERSHEDGGRKHA